MTNDLGYSKENLTFVKTICTPLNIMLSVVSGYLSNKDPFKYIFIVLVLRCVAQAYAVFGLLGTMPTDPEEQNSLWVYTHVCGVTFVLDLLGELEQTMTFGIIFSRVDKRVSALHGTILASLCNFTSFIHKTWLFWLVESYGIFYP